MELILYKLSGTAAKGVLLGTAVTAVIQSSAATSVMVVGFVNSAMMTLNQAISVILGSMLGTSITGWVVALSEVGTSSGWMSLFSTAALTAVIAVVGIIIRMTSKSKTSKYLSLVLLGFSVLMYGISSMGAAVAPLKESEAFISFMTSFSNPLLCIAVGIIATAILQSASSAAGLLAALSVTGVFNFSVTFPILLGINIGASVPILMSAAGAKTEAKRTAFSYLIMSIMGSAIVGGIYYIVNAFVKFDFATKVLDATGIAIVNTLFRLAFVLLMIPLLPFISKILTSIIHKDKTEEDYNITLEERFLASPAVALEQTKRAIISMATITRNNLIASLDLVFNYNVKNFTKISDSEDLIDRYEDKLGAYIMKLNVNSLTVQESQQASQYLHAIGDLERMSDHSLNIAECAQEIFQKKIVFSDDGRAELDNIIEAVTEVSSTAIESFLTSDLDLASRVEPLEENIDEICDEIKLHHIERLRNDQCTLDHGFVFNDLITNFERVSDHSSNIALSVIELKKNMFNPHEYVDELMINRDDTFEKYYEEYKEKYNPRT